MNLLNALNWIKSNYRIVGIIASLIILVGLQAYIHNQDRKTAETQERIIKTQAEHPIIKYKDREVVRYEYREKKKDETEISAKGNVELKKDVTGDVTIKADEIKLTNKKETNTTSLSNSTTETSGSTTPVYTDFTKRKAIGLGLAYDLDKFGIAGSLTAGDLDLTGAVLPDLIDLKKTRFVVIGTIKIF